MIELVGLSLSSFLNPFFRTLPSRQSTNSASTESKAAGVEITDEMLEEKTLPQAVETGNAKMMEVQMSKRTILSAASLAAGG